MPHQQVASKHRGGRPSVPPQFQTHFSVPSLGILSNLNTGKHQKLGGYHVSGLLLGSLQLSLQRFCAFFVLLELCVRHPLPPALHFARFITMAVAPAAATMAMIAGGGSSNDNNNDSERDKDTDHDNGRRGGGSTSNGDGNNSDDDNDKDNADNKANNEAKADDNHDR